jgi:hypothetical protein
MARQSSSSSSPDSSTSCIEDAGGALAPTSAGEPVLLGSAPIRPPEGLSTGIGVAPAGGGPFRTSATPVRATPVRMNQRRTIAAPPDEPPTRQLAPAPDGLARYLGPGRMPRVMMRFPRLSGIALVAFGLWCWRDVLRVSAEGGVYFRSITVLAPVGVLLGGWFVVFGRPADDDGYAPSWWNLGYVAMLAISAIAGLAIYGAYLS